MIKTTIIDKNCIYGQGVEILKWNSKDADIYSQSKEYVDTAVVPLIAISTGDQFKSIVSKGECTELIASELERQLKGRIFLFPPFSYIKNDNQVIESLKKWKNEIGETFHHVIFLTTEEEWKQSETEVKDDVICIPNIPLEHMDESLKKKLVQDQIEQILNILLQYWNKS